MTRLPQRALNLTYPGVWDFGIGFSVSQRALKAKDGASVLKQWFWAPTLSEPPGGQSSREVFGSSSSAGRVRVEDPTLHWRILMRTGKTLYILGPLPCCVLVLPRSLGSLGTTGISPNFHSHSFGIGQSFATSSRIFHDVYLDWDPNITTRNSRNFYYCFVVEMWKPDRASGMAPFLLY